MNKREELINKFERNMKLVFEFRENYKDYLTKKNAWNLPAFFDSRMTHRSYYDDFVRLTDIEYSSQQHDAIKSVPIAENLLDQYIQGVDSQFQNLSMLFNDLKLRM